MWVWAAKCSLPSPCVCWDRPQQILWHRPGWGRLRKQMDVVIFAALSWNNFFVSSCQSKTAWMRDMWSLWRRTSLISSSLLHWGVKKGPFRAMHGRIHSSHCEAAARNTSLPCRMNKSHSADTHSPTLRACTTAEPSVHSGYRRSERNDWGLLSVLSEEHQSIMGMWLLDRLFPPLLSQSVFLLGATNRDEAELKIKIIYIGSQSVSSSFNVENVKRFKI